MQLAIKIVKYFLCASIIGISANVYAQNSLIITGSAPLLKDGTEVSIEQIAPKRLSDRKVGKVTHLKQHNFKFIVDEAGAELYYISVGSHSKGLFLEPGAVNISIADTLLKNVTVTGSKTFAEFNKYKAMLDTVMLFKGYSRARHDYDVYVHQRTADSLTANKKMHIRDSLLLLLHHQLSGITLNWIKKYPRSLINSYVVYSALEYLPENLLKNLCYSLPVYTKDDTWGKELQYRTDSLLVGGYAPEFFQPDTVGKKVKLSNFRGKYVLVDFWASWCVPCRAENPNLVNAFRQFKDKNFTILSISMDEEKAPWLAAIRQDGLAWTHVSSLQGWQNPVAVQYYIPEIPDDFLIDPNGKIIARDIYGADLIALLNKILR